ncbi:Major Facilitator Superfamily protein [Oceanobacillus limi]|uniref:Major Facilitator Superfamily protein n=1 Tax=Oceanobacillus limi TaxID=930131 RepID=A0A1I0DSL0_9BACI|nr:MFS transporter [Oceanobacillus limi]SET35397.1 Major Facilitator Superfamily protein [Oceanobacillus limi]
MENSFGAWKQPIILLTSIGISGLGDFIYLVAINLLIYQMTGSAAAVAALWVIGPIVNVLTKFWTGSYIDYRSKRKVMIGTDIVRAVLVFFIPFLPNIWLIYTVLIGISTAKAFFVPSSMTYITQLVPKNRRKRYNSIQSITMSGAFIVGPAVGGALILLGSIDTAIFMNAASFLVSAILLYFLPEKEEIDQQHAPKLSFKQLKADWNIVFQFLMAQKYIGIVYGAYVASIIFSFAMDAQEVVFTQRVVGLSEVDYSLLISITGVGAIIGGIFVSIFSNQLSLRLMIAIGICMEAVGYVIYASSWSFLSITIGFVILGFFNAFLNAGITTFYQNNVSTKIMGRVTSMFQLIQSLVQIVFVVLVGAIADIIPLRVTISILAIGMLMIAIIVTVIVYSPSKKLYFRET